TAAVHRDDGPPRAVVEHARLGVGRDAGVEPLVVSWPVGDVLGDLDIRVDEYLMFCGCCGRGGRRGRRTAGERGAEGSTDRDRAERDAAACGTPGVDDVAHT